MKVETEIERLGESNVTRTKYFSIIEPTPKMRSVPIRLALSSAQSLNRMASTIVGVKLAREVPRLRRRAEQYCYPKDRNIISIQIEGLVRVISGFLSNCSIQISANELSRAIMEYNQLFRDGIITSLDGGMGYNNGLMLFCVARLISPEVVIESGILRGFTTYLLDRAISPESVIHAFDINLSLIEFKSSKATYYENDILDKTIELKGRRVLAFFDDHVSHYDRLQYCIDNQIDVVVLDDDVSVTTVHSDEWPPIPTANMVFNYDHIPHKFSWSLNGRTGEADISGISRSTCDLIRHSYRYEIMPDLFEFTGYRNTSVTSVLFRR
jgi:hypothetical protein